jgi:hypothetical protein
LLARVEQWQISNRKQFDFKLTSGLIRDLATALKAAMDDSDRLSPVAAALATRLKAECEAQHARAEQAEAALAALKANARRGRG